MDLPEPLASHDGDASPGLEAEAHAVEREAGLAGVGEAQVAGLEHAWRRDGGGCGEGGLRDRRGLVHEIGEPARRLAHRPRPLPGRGQGGHGLEGREGDQRDDGDLDAVQSAGAHGGDRESEDGDGGDVGPEAGQRPAQGRGADEPLLLLHHGAAQGRHRRGVALLLAEGEQLRLSLDAVHEPGGELAAEAGVPLPRAEAASARQPGGSDSARHEAHHGRGRERRPEGQEREPQEDRDRHGDEARAQHPDVEPLEGRHVLDRAAEQVPAAALHETSGGERHERAEDGDAEPGQEAQGDVVRHEPLEVPQRRPGDAEGPDADHRDRERRDRRVESRLREEPGRGAHEGDAGPDGRHLQADGDHRPPALRGEERNEPPDDHGAPCHAATSRA